MKNLIFGSHLINLSWKVWKSVQLNRRGFNFWLSLSHLQFLLSWVAVLINWTRTITKMCQMCTWQTTGKPFNRFIPAHKRLIFSPTQPEQSAVSVCHGAYSNELKKCHPAAFLPPRAALGWQWCEKVIRCGGHRGRFGSRPGWSVVNNLLLETSSRGHLWWVKFDDF